MNRNNLELDVRLPGIHGLRAVAALAVVIFHVHGIYQLDLPAYFSLIKTHFGLGVQLFFVLSAFSIFLAPTIALDGRIGFRTILFADFLELHRFSI